MIGRAVHDFEIDLVGRLQATGKKLSLVGRGNTRFPPRWGVDHTTPNSGSDGVVGYIF